MVRISIFFWIQPTTPKATANQTGKLLRASAGVQKESKNDDRDLHAQFFRWGLTLPVKVEDVTHQFGSETTITHWVRPTSWIKELMRLYPESLTGGLMDVDNIGLQFRSFWKAYRGFHAEHEIFNSNLGSLLHRVIPLALFGDEGRGPKRGQVLIWSVEGVLGLEDLEGSMCKCREAMSTLPRQDVLTSFDNVPCPCTAEETDRIFKQSTNNKNHSYLTRHVLFALPHWIYKMHPEVEQSHIALLVGDLQTLFSQGVEVNGVRWYGAVVGSKGDFKHQVAIGNLDRSYNTIGTTYGNLMCSLCLAGAPGVPFERVDHTPIWEKSLFQDRPWTNRPTLTLLHYDESKPEHLLKLDLFHLWKVGLGRDLAGSAVIVFCRCGLFNDHNAQNEGKDIDSRLMRAHGSFRLWCLSNKKSPGLQSFSKSFFSMKSFADYPWSNSKGSDTTLLNQWLHFVAVLHLNYPTPESRLQERLLRLFKNTAEQSFEAFDICYTHGMWLDRTCAKHLYTRLFLLIRGYRSLAHEAMQQGFNAWGMKPKQHAIHHVAYELRQQLLGGKMFIMNPITWGNEQNEDTVGRLARLARKVSTRTITRSTLARYFLKKKALLKRKFVRKSKR